MTRPISRLQDQGGFPGMTGGKKTMLHCPDGNRQGYPLNRVWGWPSGTGHHRLSRMAGQNPGNYPPQAAAWAKDATVHHIRIEKL